MPPVESGAGDGGPDEVPDDMAGDEAAPGCSGADDKMESIPNLREHILVLFTLWRLLIYWCPLLIAGPIYWVRSLFSFFRADPHGCPRRDQLANCSPFSQ